MIVAGIPVIGETLQPYEFERSYDRLETVYA